MKKIKIICDSLSDIDIDMAKKNDIEMIPLTVIIEDKEYKDGIDISKDDFYKKLKEENVYPKTSQVTYAQFKEVFEKYIDEETSILYIAASSTATGTYQSAVMAKNDIDGDIRVFDSQQVCYGIGRFVVEAVKLRDEGKNIDEILNSLEEMKEKVFVMFCADTLEYLQKGGRISSTKAAIGNILNIKPILYVKDGLVSQLSQVRGKKNLISKMVELAKSECKDLSGQTVYVGYTDNDKKEIDKFVNSIKENLNPDKVELFQIGTGIGTHSGPGAMGLICLKK
ncbi:DegV family protein [Peptacetobacter sp.]|uniref:DegV family protein n=1 Tax=Peptacetobacter sp. TaxID=2991975 RepID=UPI00261E2DC1|nr:DegV family protein [Peptacetobacter sp.]